MGEAKRRKQSGAVPLPTRAYEIRRSEGDAPDVPIQALIAALEEASRRRLFYYPHDLDQLLRLAEVFVDQDILRALILKDGEPPDGRGYGFAVVPATGAIEDRWYLCPLSSPHAIVFVAAVGADRYAAFRRGGPEGFAEGLEAEMKRLEQIGAWKPEG